MNRKTGESRPIKQSHGPRTGSVQKNLKRSSTLPPNSSLLCHSTTKWFSATKQSHSDLHISKKFPFFKLPREIRDYVYGFALDGYRSSYACGRAKVTMYYNITMNDTKEAEHHSIPSWFQADPQLCLEASEQLYRHAHAVFDFGSFSTRKELQIFKKAINARSGKRRTPCISRTKMVTISDVEINCIHVASHPYKSVYFDSPYEQEQTLAHILPTLGEARDLTIHLKLCNIPSHRPWDAKYKPSLHFLKTLSAPLRLDRIRVWVQLIHMTSNAFAPDNGHIRVLSKLLRKEIQRVVGPYVCGEGTQWKTSLRKARGIYEQYFAVGSRFMLCYEATSDKYRQHQLRKERRVEI